MMLDFLSNIIGGLFGLINSALPASPFDGLIQVTEGMSLGLGWLNWVIPIGDLLGIMLLWIGALVFVAAFNFVWRRTEKSLGGMLNRNGGYTV